MSLNASALAANDASSCSARAAACSSPRPARRGGRRSGTRRWSDCPMFTWSFGCAPEMVAMTSLAFMFEDVPEPVWKTSIGNCASCLPCGDLVAGGGDLLGQLGVEQPELRVDPRGVALDAPEPAHDRQRDAFSRNGEVRDGLGGLAAPQLRRGLLHAHGLLRVIYRFSNPYASAALSIDSSPVGCHGRVTSTGGIRPGRTGEVMVAIRGGVEAFLRPRRRRRRDPAVHRGRRHRVPAAAAACSSHPSPRSPK